MFRIDHVSDRHGDFPRLSPRSILVIDSGDDIPNHAPRASAVAADVEEEKRFQRVWVREHVEDYKRWLDGRIYVVSGGNHTFVNTAEILRANGINAFDIDTDIPNPINIFPSVTTVAGIRFYGFPFVPRIQGHWNGELDQESMRAAVARIPKNGIDILVAHCPPTGILCDDADGSVKLGNDALARWIDYECEELPKYLLCGHFHYSHGISVYTRDETGQGLPAGESGAMIISNAATRVHCFEYK